MSEYHSNIQLFSDSGSIHTDKYYTDLAQMDDTGFDYVQLKVEKTTGEGAVYVVYSEPNFGRAGGGKGQSYIVYPNDSGRMIRPGFSIKSFQGFNVTQPCICLFEHSQYRGNKYSTNRSLTDIRDIFPPEEVAGMSSAIALSGLWRVCTKPGFNGAKQDVDALKEKKEISLFSDLNDKIKSAELVRAS
jgi:hypothetical protein